MSTTAPMTAAQFTTAAAVWHIPLNTTRHPTWATHNRDHIAAFGPVHGMVVHHTGSSAQLAIVDYCWDGDPERGLPGPLALGVILDDGTCYMTGWGRANTQGRGDHRVLAAMTGNDVPPFPPRYNDTDGNSCFYGFEFASAGARDPFTPAQTLTAVRLGALFCDHHGWAPAAHVIGHFQWTDRKSGDPDDSPYPDAAGESLDWPAYLTAVRAALAAGPPGSPPPPQPRVSLLAVRAAARLDPPAPQGHTTHRADVIVVERALHAEGLLEARWVDGSWGTRTLTAYAAWQRRCGLHGADADGVPGVMSLTRLGHAHGFTVTP